MKWLILFLGIISNACASVLIKLAVMPPRKLPSIFELPEVLRNWPFWLGLFLYGSAFFLYTVALSRFPLNVAHPVLTAGAICAVAIFSVVVFHEPFTWTTAAGITLIIFGVILLTSRVV